MKTILTTFGALVVLNSVSQAALLLYEGFDYAAGEISDAGYSEFSPNTTEVRDSTLTFGSLSMTGREYHYMTPNAGGFTHSATKSVDLTATSGDLYMSFLMSGANLNNVRMGGGVFLNGTGSLDFGAADASVGAAVDDGQAAGYYGGILASATADYNGTLMFVLKYTGLGTASGGTAEGWLINATDYDTITAGGSATTALLDANNVDKIALLTLAGAAPTLNGTNVLELYGRDTGGAAGNDQVIDEIRVATTLNEALNIVPEPSSLALTGLGVLTLILRRRK